MKAYTFGVIIFLVLMISACHRKASIISERKPVPKQVITITGPPKFQPDSMVYHLGLIRTGEVKSMEIGFVNGGGEALEIKLVSACECTKVDWPVLPIPSGERRTLKISYDSREKSGPQIVDLDIITNAAQEHTFIKLLLEVSHEVSKY